MEREYRFKDEDGKEHVEKLSAVQGNVDDQVLKDFGGLEVCVSQGQVFNDAHKITIARVLENVKKLTKNRAAHWMSELERIGAVAARPTPAGKETSGGAK